jgi:putative FmdB family regulatory protein
MTAVPIYEYKCSKCAEVFEAFQKITDLPLTECKYCGSRVEKLISHSSFQLKGSGWYLTDYAKKSSSPASSDSEGTKSAKAPAAGESAGSAAGPAPTKSDKAEKSST